MIQNDFNVLKAYGDYTIHKFTYSELEEKYGKSAKTLRRYFDKLSLAELKNDLGEKKEINSGQTHLNFLNKGNKKRIIPASSQSFIF